MLLVFFRIAYCIYVRIVFIFKEEGGGDDDSGGELGVENVGGVFVVLGIGCGVAAGMGIFEFLWNVREVAIEQKVQLICQTDFIKNNVDNESPHK